LLGAPIATNCKRLTCKSCGPRRRAEILKHIRAGFPTDAPLRFLTFTYPWETGYESTADGVAAANRDFRYFVQELRRRGFVVEYAKVIEFTKRGRVHLHALTVGSFIPKCTDAGRRSHGLPVGRGSGSPCYCTAAKPCLQSLAWSAGFGFVDARRVPNPEAAAAYIAKYLTKSCADNRWPKYARRYTTSRRWAKITLAGIHRQWVEQLRAQHGNNLQAVCTPPAEVIAWQLIPRPTTASMSSGATAHPPGLYPCITPTTSTAVSGIQTPERYSTCRHSSTPTSEPTKTAGPAALVQFITLPRRENTVPNHSPTRIETPDAPLDLILTRNTAEPTLQKGLDESPPPESGETDRSGRPGVPRVGGMQPGDPIGNPDVEASK